MKLNLPNKLTVLRLLGTLIFLAFASIPASVESHLTWWRIGYVVAVIAAWTDFFDGYLARKYDLVTDFGKLMDPLADKVFTLTCFVVLTSHGYVPAWITCEGPKMAAKAASGAIQMASQAAVIVSVWPIGTLISVRKSPAA